MMTMELNARTDLWYRQAERKAADYFASLKAQLANKSYAPRLIEDFRTWNKSHVRRSFWSRIGVRTGRKPDSSDYGNFIRWLKVTGKLDDYLDRSVSYMYLRDLGHHLASSRTQAKIKKLTADIKKRLLAPGGKVGKEFASLSSLYRWSQKEGVELTVIWLIDKLKQVASHIPDGMNEAEARRKLIKIIVGVVMHALDGMEEGTPPAERSRKLEEAIKLGYFYGLTYPFIDDLLDSGVLDEREKKRYSGMIREVLSTGNVPEPGEWSGRRAELMRYIHAELRDAYEYMKSCQSEETLDEFFRQSYIFFHSQDADRSLNLEHAHYTNEELYVPIIVKSASSRLIVRSIMSAPKDEGFDDRTFYYGLYNQLADDFADMFDDMNAGAVTPYTYYMKYRRERPDLINPFELYWAVVSHLIHHVYGSDSTTREVMLDRAVNGLKRFRRRAGDETYRETIGILAFGHPELDRLIDEAVRKAEDVEFFDKLLRDQLLTAIRSEREEKERFEEIVREAQTHINELLPIPRPDGLPSMGGLLVDTANYSLKGGGKRLRPALAWVMGVNEYGLQPSQLAPLFRSLEYMHTASLIFDDLPSQDNSSTRRGLPTLHRVHDSATAELTGLYLIQKGIEQLSSLKGFDSSVVLALVNYSAQKASEICIGQAMDLQSKGKLLTLDQLNAICFYKTGIAFEVSLVAPAILAKAESKEIETLQKFAYHAGIAFQIKDDLLDSKGDSRLLGKPSGKDEENNTSTFATLLGTDGAGKAMWEHYCLAMEALNEMAIPNFYLKHLLSYMINRDS